MAVKVEATPVPLDDAAVEIPHKDRLPRKLYQALFLEEILLAVTEGLLDLQAFGNIHERNNDTVDLVFDRTVRPQPNIVPSSAAAFDFTTDRGEVGKHRQRVLGQ